MEALKSMISLPKADTEAMLTKTGLAVLIVMGTKDADFPDPSAEAQWAADRLGGELLLVQDAGPYPQTEMPDEVGPAIVSVLERRDGAMPRAGLEREVVLQTAVTIADSEGLESLTIAKLALHLGVKAPSLYNHIRNLDCVKDDLTTQAMLLLLDRTRDAMAGVAGRDALDALGNAQRQFARDHPGLWAATQLRVAGWNEASQKTADTYLALVLAVLRGYGAAGDQAIHAARFIRASLRGFIDLELGGGFGLSQDVDASFRTLLHLLDAGLRSLTLQ